MRQVTFTATQIETRIAWQGGEEFSESEFYKQAEITLLEAMQPNPRTENGKVIVEITNEGIELVPTSQRAAENLLKKLGWNISPLFDYELTLVEKGKI